MSSTEDAAVLLVDDQPAKLLSYGAILGGMGVTLVTASSGREALDHLLRKDFAVVLIDVCMPELDGFELASMIRGHPRFQKTAIIFVSGVHMSDFDRLKGYAHGAVDYVPVPVVPEILRAKVNVFVDLFRKTRQLERMNQELERRVSERTSELQEAARRKDEFLAMLAHELRNPLAAIRLAAQLLGFNDLPPAQLTGCIAVIQRQVEHLVRLIDDLVDVSRITRGLISLRHEPTDLSAVIAQAIETARPLIDARRHTLSVDVADGPLLVDGDIARLSQVVANILNNAAKFTDPGGRIELRVWRDTQHAAIEVKDNGRGIAREMLPHIFDLFTHSDQPLDRAVGGLGIGLAIVRQLVEMHGGSVRARSDGPGTGAEVLVRLPILLGSSVALTVPAGRGETAVRPIAPCRVLVVDDNRDAAETLAVMLRMRGHEVQVAQDGLEALNVAPAFLPQVVMLDLGMPNLNGFETASRIRREPWGRDLPLIAVTGWGQPKDRQRTVEAGFNAHLVKPVGQQELLEAISRVVQPNLTLPARES
jgi:signal transduction histidine kinase